MAEALLRGLHESPAAFDLCGSHPRQVRRDELLASYGCPMLQSNAAVATKSDILVICVKPTLVPEVLAEVADSISPETLVISVAAGLSTQLLESNLGSKARVIRAMPNTPCLVQEGATGLCLGKNAGAKEAELAKAVFEPVGKTFLIPESQMNSLTGLSGSGPAYMFLILDALADAGVKVGLSRSHSLELAGQTMLGAAKLLLETGKHPGELKDMVTTPGGTTIVGLHTLEEGGIRTTLMNAVEAATNRANALGKDE